MPERLRGAERYPEPQKVVERERSLTAPKPEPYHPDQGDDSPWEEPEKSGWELPEPGTYGFRTQFRQDEARQRQALAGVSPTPSS